MIEHHTIAQTIGLFMALYLFCVGFGCVIDKKGYASVIDEFRHQAGKTFLAGALTFVIGATIISLHDTWGTTIDFIITLVGWIALIMGSLILAFRKAFFSFVDELAITEKFVRNFGFGCMLVAAFLAYLI